MASPNKQKRIYEFGPFRADASERLVLRNGEAVPLTPKAFDTLLFLLENHGRLIEKGELLRAVWPDTSVEEGIVAVNVSALRKALGDEDNGKGYVETVPRRGYRFIASVRETDAVDTGEAGMKQKRSRRSLYWVAGSSAVLLVAVLASTRFPRPEVEAPRIIPLTTYPGSEESPSFSPDGSQFAFSWNGERQDNFDIYIRLVRGGPPVRLTTDPAPDTRPLWSPDGNWIAFERDGSLMLVSPLGGVERKLLDFDARNAVMPTDFTWARDSRSLAVSLGHAGIYRVWLDTLEKQRLTTPPESDFGDSSPAFTQDGQSLVFARLPTASSTDIYVQSLGGKPSPLLTGASRISNVVMIPNSQEIIYEIGGLGLATRRRQPMGQNSRLWRMSIDTPVKPEPLAGIAEGAGAPAIFRAANGKMSLAFEKRLFDVNIWFMPLEGTQTPRPLINSTRIDSNPQFSPDGQRIAFSSDRSGSLEIWVCKSDGSKATQLTNFGADMVYAPQWSSDGRKIAFAVLSHGNRDVYYIDADGGVAKRLTSESSEEGRPSWSQDGKWIYFYSNRSGTQQIWKRALADGQTLQVTRGGGHEAFESPDGKLVIYTRPGVSGLWTVPVGNQVGESAETKLLDRAQNSTWAVTKAGVYFVDFESNFKSGRPLCLYRFSTRSVQQVASIQGEIGRITPSLSVANDGSSILWAQIDRAESDLMLVENFR